MSLELGIAIVAVIVSVVSFEVNLRTAKAAERHGRMPTGTGELATQDVRDIRLSRRKHGRMWRGYAHLQPIAAGSERCYLWDWDKAVGLSYTDALGKPYALLTSAYGTKLFDGAAMPHPLLNELRYPQRCD